MRRSMLAHEPHMLQFSYGPRAVRTMQGQHYRWLRANALIRTLRKR